MNQTMPQLIHAFNILCFEEKNGDETADGKEILSLGGDVSF